MRIDELLQQLKVTEPKAVTVAPVAHQSSGSLQAAREHALQRRGKRAARAGGVELLISESDARLLIQHGAAEMKP